MRVAFYIAALLNLLLLDVSFARDLSSFSATEISRSSADLLKQLEARFGPKDRYTRDEILSLETPKPAMFNAKDVKAHFEIIGKLDPTKTHLFDKLVTKFGKKAMYSADEVRAIESPRMPSKRPRTEDQPQSRIDSFSKEEVRTHFELLRSSDPKSKASMEALEKKYPSQDRYSAAQVRDVEKNGEEWSTTAARPETSVTFLAAQQASADRSLFLDGWKTPLVRHDWTDVLSVEDPSAGASAKAKKTDDLVGATFSYSHDVTANTDTWTTVGALIWPWAYYGSVHQSLLPSLVIIAPSIGVNRISTSGNPSVETDQVLYRLGFFGRWYEGLGPNSELQMRAAPVFGTNTGHEARMPGYEVDLEPRWWFNNGKSNGENGECIYKIGFTNTLWFKSALLADGSDQSVLHS